MLPDAMLLQLERAVAREAVRVAKSTQRLKSARVNTNNVLTARASVGCKLGPRTIFCTLQFFLSCFG